MKRLISSAFLTAIALSQVAEAATVIGGFGDDRAGAANLVGGPFAEELRAAVAQEFDDSTFVAGETLDASFLSRVNILLIGAPTFAAPISLTSAEQANLLSFIKAGHGAIIFVDNDSYAGVPESDLANETFLDPFGIDSTGYIGSPAAAKRGATLHPVTDGKHGRVETAAGYFPGWFDNPGQHAVVVVRYEENNQPAVLAIPENALGPGSGRVVFLSDANLLADSADGGYFGVVDNRALVLNAIEYVSNVPEPSAAAMLAFSMALVATYRRQRAH